MPRTHLLLVPVLAAGCVLTSPEAVVAKRDPAFDLARLAGERVAVWPVATATVDPAAAKALTQQYGSEEGFLDSLGKTVSGRLVRPGGPASLASDEVVARLGGAAETRALLDARRLLGADAGSRFSGPPVELAKLRSVPALEGIRYALLFPGVSMDREQTVSSLPSTGAFTATWARGRLRLAVVDLGSGSVVWEGELLASGKLNASGMKQIEEGLGAALEQRLASAAAPAQRPAGGGRLGEPGARCESSADCAYGACISRACR